MTASWGPEPTARHGTIVGPSRAEQFRAAERRIQLVTKIMDDLVPIPGTGQRVGLDPVIGLVPGIGDIVAAVAGVWVIMEAARFGVPTIALVRMTWNWGADLVVGAVPVLGDLFDVAFRSNHKNLDIFRRHALDPAAGTGEHGQFLAGLGLVVVGILWVIWSAIGGLLSTEIRVP